MSARSAVAAALLPAQYHNPLSLAFLPPPPGPPSLVSPVAVSARHSLPGLTGHMGVDTRANSPLAALQVLEETPSPLLDQTLRDKLTGAAVALGKSSKYRCVQQL